MSMAIKLLPVLVASLAATLISGCSSPYVSIGRWCIFVNNTAPSSGPGRPVSWPVARSSCQSTDGDLVVLDDQDKLIQISKHIDETFPVETSQGWVYWAGAYGTGSNWQWVNSRPVNLLSNIWLPDHPKVTGSQDAPLYAKLVPADNTHGRKYLLTADTNGVSPAHICEAN